MAIEIVELPSGKHNYGKLPFIVDLPSNSMVTFQFAMLNYQRVGAGWTPSIDNLQSGWSKHQFYREAWCFRQRYNVGRFHGDP